jgi:hypothetical protein
MSDNFVVSTPLDFERPRELDGTTQPVVSLRSTPNGA